MRCGPVSDCQAAGVKPSRAVLAAVLVVLVAGVVLVCRVGYVRVAYGEWGVAPSSSPPRMMLGGREYRRADRVAEVAAGDVVIGHAAGGEVYGPPDARFDPTVVELRTDAGIFRYSLVGGP
jgi:hypothetical protein